MLLSKIFALLNEKGDAERIGCLRLLREASEEVIIELRLNVLGSHRNENNSLLLNMSSDALK